MPPMGCATTTACACEIALGEVGVGRGGSQPEYPWGCRGVGWVGVGVRMGVRARLQVDWRDPQLARREAAASEHFHEALSHCRRLEAHHVLEEEVRGE